MKRRILTFLLSAAMMLTSVNVPAYAAGNGAGSEPAEEVVIEETTAEAEAAKMDTSNEVVIEESAGAGENTENIDNNNGSSEGSATEEVIEDIIVDTEGEEYEYAEVEEAKLDTLTVTEIGITEELTKAGGALAGLLVNDSSGYYSIKGKDHDMELLLTPYHHKVYAYYKGARKTGVNFMITNGVKNIVENVTLDSNTSSLQRYTSLATFESNAMPGTTYTITNIQIPDSTGKKSATRLSGTISVTTMEGVADAYILKTDDPTYNSIAFTAEVKSRATPTVYIKETNNEEAEFVSKGTLSPGIVGKTISGLKADTEYTVSLRNGTLEYASVDMKTAEAFTSVDADIDGTNTATGANIKVTAAAKEGVTGAFTADVEYKKFGAASPSKSPNSPVSLSSGSATIELTGLAADSTQIVKVRIYEGANVLWEKEVEVTTPASVGGITFEQDTSDAAKAKPLWITGTISFDNALSDSPNLRATIRPKDSFMEAAESVSLTTATDKKSATFTVKQFGDKDNDDNPDPLEPETYYEVEVFADGTKATSTTEFKTGHAENGHWLSITGETGLMMGVGFTAKIEGLPADDGGKTTIAAGVCKNNAPAQLEVIPAGNTLSPDETEITGSASKTFRFRDTFYDGSGDFGINVTPNSENKWVVIAEYKPAGGGTSEFYYQFFTAKTATIPYTLDYKAGENYDFDDDGEEEDHSGKLYANGIKDLYWGINENALDESITKANVGSISKKIYYKKTSETEWTEATNYLGSLKDFANENDFLPLEEGVPYDIALSLDGDPDAAFASIQVTTPKGYADYSVTAADVEYNNAQIRVRNIDWNYYNMGYVLAYRAANDADGWRKMRLSTDETDEYGYALSYKANLTGLNAGTEYEAKVDFVVGGKVVKTQLVSFTTKAEFIHPTVSAAGGAGKATVTIDVLDGGNKNFKAIAWIERVKDGNDMYWISGDGTKSTYSITSQMPSADWGPTSDGDEVVYFGKKTGPGTIEIDVPNSYLNEETPEGGTKAEPVATEFVVKTILFQSYNNGWKWYVDQNNKRVIEGNSFTVTPSPDVAPAGPASMKISDVYLNKSYASNEGYYSPYGTSRSVTVNAYDKDDKFVASFPTLQKTEWKIADEKVAKIRETSSGKTRTINIDAVGKGQTEVTVTVTTGEGTDESKWTTWDVAKANVYVGDYKLYVRPIDTATGEEKTGDNDWVLPTHKDASDLAKKVIYAGDTRHFAIGKFDGTNFVKEEGVSWGSNNESAKVTDGALTGIKYGTTNLYGITADSIELHLDVDKNNISDTIQVYNKVLGIAVDEIVEETSTDYPAIKNSDTSYTVVAGEDYTISVVPSPGYTANDDTRTLLTVGKLDKDGKFDGATGEYAITATKSDGTAAPLFKAGTATETFSIPTANIGEEFSITLTPRCPLAKPITFTVKGLAKPDIESAADTFVWLPNDSKTTATVGMAKLPKGEGFEWKFKNPGEEIPAEGFVNVDVVYSGKNAAGKECYPLEDTVRVYARRTPYIRADWSTQTGGRYLDAKSFKYYLAKGGKLYFNPGLVFNTTGEDFDNLVEATPLDKEAKNISYNKPTTGNIMGNYILDPAESRTYSLGVDYYDFDFEVKSKAWSIKKGESRKDVYPYTVSVTVGGAPYGTIEIDNTKKANDEVNFEWEDISQTIGRGTKYDLVYKLGKKISDTESNAISFKTAAKAKVTLVVKEDTTAKAVVPEPKFKSITSSNPKVAAVPKTGALDKSVLTLDIPKNAEGMAMITLVADDGADTTTSFAVMIRNYKTQVLKTNKATFNTNCYNEDNEWPLAQVVIPYEYDAPDKTTGDGENSVVGKPVIVTSDKADVADAVSGLDVWLGDRNEIAKGYSYDVMANIKKNSGLKAADSKKKYWIRLETKMGGATYIPIKLTFVDKMPKAKVKQNQAVNLFYTDTTRMEFADDWTGVAKPLLSDGVAMGYFTITADKGERIRDVVWRPKDAVAAVPSEKPANNDLIIKYEESWWNNSVNTEVYSIRQNDPTMKGKVLANGKAATDGYLYVYFNGYDTPVAVPFKTKTAYKVPKLKAEGKFNTTPDIGQYTSAQPVSINAYPAALKKSVGANYNWLTKQTGASVKDYLRFTSSNTAVAADTVAVTGGNALRLTYSGEKAAASTITFFSDYWNEPLVLKVNVKPAKTSIKLNPAKIVLNTNRPGEIYQTGSYVSIRNAKVTSGYVKDEYIDMLTLNVTGIGKAQELIDKKYINIVRDDDGTLGGTTSDTRLLVTVNNEKAMSGIKPGSYKFKVGGVVENKGTGSDVAVKDVVLTLQIINKPAGVKLAKSGKIDLSKYNAVKNNKRVWNSAIKVKPKFSNLNNAAVVGDPTLGGTFRGQFGLVNSEYNRIGAGKPGGGIYTADADGTFYIVPNGTLYAGKKYELTISYMITDKDVPDDIGSKIAYTVSETFTIIPNQSKVKASAKPGKVTIYASQDETAWTRMAAPDFTSLWSCTGRLDVNGDGRADITVTSNAGEAYAYSGSATDCYQNIWASLTNPEACTAGKTYKVPVRVTFNQVGGGTFDVDTTVNVTIKK